MLVSSITTGLEDLRSLLPASALSLRIHLARDRATCSALDTVEAAALLHDIGHGSGRDGHAMRGAEIAAEILSRASFPDFRIGGVIDCIEHHHWMPGRAGDPIQPSIEYEAFADADRLDALGAVGIARTFAFGGVHRRPIWRPEPDAKPNGLYGISSVHHFYEKLLRLPEDMYTEPGRRLAVRRVGLMKDFLNAFFVEWEGQDCELMESDRGAISFFTGTPPEMSGKGPQSPLSDPRPDPSI